MNQTPRPRTSPVRPMPVKLPAGLTLSNGVTLMYEPHRNCGCIDCRTAFEDYANDFFQCALMPRRRAA